MVITVGCNTLSNGKFHNRGYSDILYGINSIDIMGCCTPEESAIYHKQMVITLFYSGGGGGKRLPKFKFSAKFDIGLHVILQIQIKKFENDCYIL